MRQTETQNCYKIRASSDSCENAELDQQPSFFNFKSSPLSTVTCRVAYLPMEKTRTCLELTRSCLFFNFLKGIRGTRIYIKFVSYQNIPSFSGLHKMD